MLKANFTMRLGVVVERYTLSLAFRAAFTFENASRGIRSGVYGGRNTSRAPTPVMMSYTPSRWWILALSITTTDRGLFPSNSSIMGNTH